MEEMKDKDTKRNKIMVIAATPCSVISRLSNSPFLV